VCSFVCAIMIVCSSLGKGLEALTVTMLRLREKANCKIAYE
jgi:hypothetical protein